MLAPPIEEALPLLKRRPFRLLTYSRFTSRLAQNAANFALVLLVVEETGKAFTSSLLVLVLVLPATLGGIVAGAIADALPKRPVIFAGNLFRAAVCTQFAMSDPGVASYFIVGALLSLGTQFATAPEGPLTLTVVERNEITRANAINHAAGGAAQLLGFGVVTPIALRVFDQPSALFAVCAGLYILAAFQVVFVRPQKRFAAAAVSIREPRVGPWWKAGWSEMRRDPGVMRAAVELTLISTALIVLAGLLPAFIKDELGLPVDIGAIVFVPAAVGVVLGLRIAGFLAHRVPHAAISTVGIASFAILLGVLALTNQVASFLVGYGAFGWLDTAGIGSLQRGGILAAIIALPLGFSYAVVVVAAQTLIAERVPLQLQGRVLATQGAIAAFAASVPVMAAGVVADVAGVSIVMFVLAAGIGLVGFSNLRGGGSGEVSVPAPVSTD